MLDEGSAKFAIKNQIASKAIWFFGSISLWVACVWAVAALIANNVFSQQAGLPESVAQWSRPFWIDQLDRASRALTNKALDPEQIESLGSIPPTGRLQAFDRFLTELLESKECASANARAWMLDHFQLSDNDSERELRIRRSGWDSELYRSWLFDCFHKNLRFDQLVQQQLSGGDSTESKVPTHAWYLANQWGNYQILRNPTPIESNLARQFQAALDSIQRTEAKDWKRLLDHSIKETNEIKSWWQQQRTWPKAPVEDLVWSWPSGSESLSAPQDTRESLDGLVAIEPPAKLAGNRSYRVYKAPAMKMFREWSLVLTARFSKELIESSQRVPVFIQSSDGKLLDPEQRSMVIEMRRGFLHVKLTHDTTISQHEVLTRNPLPADRIVHLAIINDGLGNSDSIRILIDGQQEQAEPHEGAEGCYKEIVFDQENCWAFLAPTDGDWQIDEVAFYRVALSVPECRGLSDSMWLDTWDDLERKEEWVKHYAMRVDPQWRYQRESRSHYVSNLKSIYESESMLPVLAGQDQPIFLVQADRFPLSLVSENTTVASTSDSVAQSTARAWSVPGENIKFETLARSEIRRTWRMMLRHLELPDRDVNLSGQLLGDFMSDWDRRRMIRSLVPLIIEER